MKISVGADHGGYILREAVVAALQEDGHEVIDHGVKTADSVDYPDFAKLVADDVKAERVRFGVLICTTGMGIAIAANKVNGIRAAVVYNDDLAEYARKHNDANIICFGQKYQTPYMAKRHLRKFLATGFDGGERHERRIDKICGMRASTG